MKRFFSGNKVGVVFLTALLIRLCILLCLSPRIQNMENERMGDASDYKAIARHWSRGFPHVLDPNAELPNGSNRAPLYPLFLSLVAYPRDSSWMGGRLLGCLWGAGIAVACLLLGKVTIGQKSSWIAGLLCGIYPFLVFYSLLILTETLFTLFLTISLFFWCMAREKGNLRSIVFLGISLALSALTRPVVLLLPLLIAGDVIREKRKMSHGLLLCLTFFFLLSPYLVMQRIQYGCWIPITTEGGRSFYQGNNPMNRSGGAIRGVDYEYPSWAENMNEAASSRALMAEGLRYVLDRPLLFLLRASKKVARLWAFIPSQASGFQGIWTSLANAFVVLPLYGLAFLGAIMSRSEWRKQIPLYVILLYTTLFCAVFTGSQRFRLPLVPCLAIWASAPLQAVSARLCRRPPQTP